MVVLEEQESGEVVTEERSGVIVIYSLINFTPVFRF